MGPEAVAGKLTPDAGARAEATGAPTHVPQYLQQPSISSPTTGRRVGAPQSPPQPGRRPRAYLSVLQRRGRNQSTKLAARAVGKPAASRKAEASRQGMARSHPPLQSVAGTMQQVTQSAGAAPHARMCPAGRGGASSATAPNLATTAPLASVYCTLRSVSFCPQPGWRTACKPASQPASLPANHPWRRCTRLEGVPTNSLASCFDGTTPAALSGTPSFTPASAAAIWRTSGSTAEPSLAC